MRVSCLTLSGLPTETGGHTRDTGHHDEGCQVLSPGRDSSCRRRIKEERLGGMEFELKLKEWGKYDSLTNGEPL